MNLKMFIQRWQWLIVGLLATLMGVFVGGRYLEPAPVTGSAQEQAFARLMDTHLTNVEGKTVALADFKGKTIVLNFWAPWCPPCVEEMPELSQVQSEFSSKNIQFIGIGIDSADNIAQFSKNVKTTYPLLVASSVGLELAKAFGNTVGGLPFTVLIRPDGQVIQQKTGRIQAQELREWLNKSQ